jgi:hypothetical protein
MFLKDQNILTNHVCSTMKDVVRYTILSHSRAFVRPTNNMRIVWHVWLVILGSSLLWREDLASRLWADGMYMMNEVNCNVSSHD